MKKYKVIICDDEENARLIIRQYLDDRLNLEIVRECVNGEEAVEAIDTLEPDLLFLDIQMPLLSGFQVLQNIIHIPKIIFSTAYDRYALKAFDSNAVDYLLKPFTKERFSIAIDKALSNRTVDREGLISLTNDCQRTLQSYPAKLFLESGNRMIGIQLDDIIWCEAQGDYTYIHMANRKHLSNFGIGALEQKFNPEKFLRIHRSEMLNIRHVREVVKEPTGLQIIMTDGSVHKVGRSYSDAIKQLLI